MQKLIFTILIAALPYTSSAAPQVYDLVVYGGTSAGISGAITAARLGKSTIIIEPGDHLGGLTSGGLGWTDSGNKSVIGGLSREFYQRVKDHYDHPSAWVFDKPEEYGRYRAKDDAMWTFEPKVAEDIFEQMLHANAVPVVKRQRLNRASGVVKKGERIISITMESGEVYHGRMFMDATYEGDLLAAAGVSYHVGREANSVYGETLNGIQKRRNTHNHRFMKKVDPYVKPGDPSSGLLPGVHGDDPGKDGDGDHRLQAYCYRMCMSNDPRNLVPFPKPNGYNERRYELLFRNFEAGDRNVPMKPDMMPNRKTDTNNNYGFSTDNIGMNYAYPEASYAERARILAEHERYQKGLMWSLANHPRVPKSIRAEVAKWGLAADEFTDNGNWPHQIYVREARRMVTDYVVTELDCRRERVAPDSVGLGSYNMDSHNVQRYVTPEGYAQNEGDIQVSPGGAYIISYRSLIPKHGEAENLFSPTCVAASHIAFGSIRMEPVFMILGQSAATAASIAIDEKIAVQDVEYAKLRKILIENGQVLDLPKNSKPKILFSKDKLQGTVIDETEATHIGAWPTSSSTHPFVEGSYVHDGDLEKGEKSVRFETQLKPGRYEVRVSYSVASNRARKVPVIIQHAEGEKTVSIDQRSKPPIAGLFTSVGVFQFNEAKPATVIISNKGTKGHVIADAVQFLPVKGK